MTRRVLWPRDPFDRIVLPVHETPLHQWDPPFWEMAGCINQAVTSSRRLRDKCGTRDQTAPAGRQESPPDLRFSW